MSQLDREELTCPCCGGARLHLERLTAQCRHAVSPVASRLVVGFGALDGDARRIWRNAPSRQDGVALRFACGTCHMIVELAFAVQASCTAVRWQELAREIAEPA
jgi:hypothetical protein